jgi:hypothetical protein
MLSDTPNNVVILGCGRSGTSILGELFEHLPEYKYLFEPQLSEIKEYKKDHKSIIACKVPKGGSRLTEGLACDMNELLEILGSNTKIIWIVRNPLDTICSLRPGIEDNWNHNPRPPDYLELLNKPWHIKCSYHWNFINKNGFKSANKFGKVLVLKYEDFINNPTQSIQIVLDYINSKTPLNNLDKYTKLIRNSTKNSYHAKFQVHWFRNNHSSRIGRYKENMSEKEINESLMIVNKTKDQFFYEYGA